VKISEDNAYTQKLFKNVFFICLLAYFGVIVREHNPASRYPGDIWRLPKGADGWGYKLGNHFPVEYWVGLIYWKL